MKVLLKSMAVAKSPKVQGWLRPNVAYFVLAIEKGASGRMCYRIESEQNRTPALFEIELFDLVDNRLPSIWIATQDGDDAIEFKPAQWCVEGFWELYFEMDPDVRRTYEETVSEMRLELGEPAES